MRRDFQGALINDLEALETRGVPARKLLLMDEGFGKDVVREVITPDSTGDADARAVADLLSRHMEKARLRMNEAGASIGRLEGYMPQSHDAWKMTSGGARPRRAGSILSASGWTRKKRSVWTPQPPPRPKGKGKYRIF